MSEIDEAYKEIYSNMGNGIYDTFYFDLEKGRKSVGIDVKLVKRACSENGIDFKEFMEYARARKKEETK